MPDPVDPLVDDLCEFLARAPRPYAEVMEAWKTSCPRLPVWEEANARGYVQCHADRTVGLTPAGRQRLGAARRR